jgi:hypothetical protein
VTPAEPIDTDDFQRRVVATRVDLVDLIKNGLPPLEFLPKSEGMLIKGRRHLIAAPRKEGKSIAMLAHWARIALEEERVMILDRENGAQTYAERLDAIIQAWDLGARDLTRLRRNLHYYEFPRLRPIDGEYLADLARGAAVVVFDSQRMFLTDLGLRESESDDYAEFMTIVIEPLFRAGVATVILDNTGHNDRSRSRGTSAKGDLNELLFTLKAEDDFSKNRQGKVKLILAPGDSRFGTEGEWEMHIGGGAFSEWKRVGDDRPIDPAFQKAAGSALLDAGVEGLSQTKLLDSIRATGLTFSNAIGRDWLYRLAADPAVEIHMLPPDKAGLPAMFFGGPSDDEL